MYFSAALSWAARSGPLVPFSKEFFKKAGGTRDPFAPRSTPPFPHCPACIRTLPVWRPRVLQLFDVQVAVSWIADVFRFFLTAPAPPSKLFFFFSACHNSRAYGRSIFAHPGLNGSRPVAQTLSFLLASRALDLLAAS